MRRMRLTRLFKALVPGAIALQAAGCGPEDFNEFLQTVFLGITAAGAIAILDNI